MEPPNLPNEFCCEPLLRDLVIKEMLITDLLPLNRRARRHRRKQIRQIADSIATFGFVVPILIDDRNRVIAGHGRVLAAQLLDVARVPTIRLSGMTEARLRAFAIADNKLAELAEWDEEILAIEFAYIHTLDIDLDLTVTGFATTEIDLIIGDAALEEPEPEIPPITNEPPITRLGDLWLLGTHRLLCGDARDAAAYARLMDCQLAAMVFTDPPYNLRISEIIGKGRRQHREFAMASGEMTEDAFRAFLQAVLTHIAALSRDGSLHFCCMDWRHIQLLLAIGRAVYTELKNVCVWDKGRGGMGSLYRSQHELVAVFKLGQSPHINNIELGRYGRNRTNLWRYPPARPRGEADLDLHPTAKPISMVADAIMDCSHRGDIVLDPFGGSGTTLLAAERTGRHGHLMELDPRYVDLIIRRWQVMTGHDAVLESSYQGFDDLAGMRPTSTTHRKINHGR